MVAERAPTFCAPRFRFILGSAGAFETCRAGHMRTIGHIVQHFNNRLLPCVRARPWYNLSMIDPITPEEFDALYIARVKALRQLRGMTAGQMSTLLGVPAERYRKYESRTPMPHALMEQFALITGVSVEFLLTGRRVAGKGPYPDVPGPHMIEKWRAGQLDSEGKSLRRRD